MVWKEVWVEGNVRFNRVGRFFIALLVLGSFAPVIIIAFALGAVGRVDTVAEFAGAVYAGVVHHYNQFGEGVNVWLRVMNTVVGTLMLLGVAARSAGAVGVERDRDTLTSLMTTPLTTQEMAGLSHVPAGYLAKVLGALRRAGIVCSQRGAGGGHVLGREPSSLSLLEVIRVADVSHRIPICPLGIGSHGTRLCALHRRLDSAVEVAEQTLGKTTIADVLADSMNRPLCEHKRSELEVARAGHG